MAEFKKGAEARPDSEPKIVLTPGQRYWAAVLTAFPFVFIPLVAVLGLLAAVIGPWLTGADDR